MSLGYTAHSIWDSSHKQIGGTQKKKRKKNMYIKKYFKFKGENCLCKIIYVSMYVFVLGYEINELYLNSSSRELKNIQY